MNRHLEFVFFADQAPLTPTELSSANTAAAYVRKLFEQRDDYVSRHGLDRDIWMPAANWHSGQPFYRYASELLNGNATAIELLRIYAQQFTGYALWCMSKGPDTPLPPLDRAAIEARLQTVKPDEQSITICTRLRTELPEYLQIRPPAKFGEVGWVVDGFLVNYDVAAYWERLLLLHQAGFLSRTSSR